MPKALPKLESKDAQGAAAVFGVPALAASEGSSVSQQSDAQGTGRLRIRRLAGGSANMRQELAGLVSFEGQMALRRASQHTMVLRMFGAILSQAGGSAETYALSEEVASIDLFLSHNWAVSRTKKFLCLALHFNLRLGFFMAVGITFVIAVASSLGAPPLLVLRGLSTLEGAGIIEYSPTSTLVALPVLFFFVLSGHEFQRLAGYRSCTVFLDKTCIHQADKDLQQKGILKLGAFLRTSSKMVVIYTDLYLKKLWTVYEVACFLSLHPTSDLIILPTFQPVVVLGATIVFYCTSILYMVLWSLEMDGSFLIGFVGFGTCLAAGLAIFRCWAREKDAIRKRTADFRVEQCICTVEADRQVVYKNIALLMRAVGAIEMHATEDEALSAFNRLVRERLSRSLNASIGSIGVSYFQAMSPFLLMYLTEYIDGVLLGTLPYPEEWIARYRFWMAVNYGVSGVAIGPIFVFFFCTWAGLCLHLRSVLQWMFMGLGVFLNMLAFMVFTVVRNYLFWAAVVPSANRHVFAMIYAIFNVSCLLITALIYWRARHPNEEDDGECEKYPAEEEEHEEDEDTPDWEVDMIRC